MNTSTTKTNFSCKNKICRKTSKAIKTIFIKNNLCVGIGYFCKHCSTRVYNQDFRNKPISSAEIIMYARWLIKMKKARNNFEEPEIQILFGNRLMKLQV